LSIFRLRLAMKNQNSCEKQTTSGLGDPRTTTRSPWQAPNPIPFNPSHVYIFGLDDHSDVASSSGETKKYCNKLARCPKLEDDWRFCKVSVKESHVSCAEVIVDIGRNGSDEIGVRVD